MEDLVEAEVVGMVGDSLGVDEIVAEGAADD